MILSMSSTVVLHNGCIPIIRSWTLYLFSQLIQPTSSLKFDISSIYLLIPNNSPFFWSCFKIALNFQSCHFSKLVLKIAGCKFAICIPHHLKILGLSSASWRISRQKLKFNSSFSLLPQFPWKTAIYKVNRECKK